jgi:hypothetical protein
MTTKADDLSASLPGTGTISDRLYEREKTEYVGADDSAPLSLDDYLTANGEDKRLYR